MTVLHQPVKALISIGSLWHQRLGHPSNQIVKTLGLPPTSETCEVCLTGKLSLLSFSGSFEKAQHPLECIHLDVVGPISPSSNTGLKYFLTIVDQFTLFKTVMFLKTKSKAFNEFVKWEAFSKNFNNTRIKNLVSDRGGEFENEQFKHLATSCGLIHIFSPTATPEHNGFAERANRTILNKARCLLIRSNLPRSYWAKAVNTATFLSNLIPTSLRNNKSPFVLWASKLPWLKILRDFGCKTFILVQWKDRYWKLSPTSEEGILLGFKNDNLSYQILQLQYKKVVVTRHTLFIEDHFPFLDKGSDCTDCSRWVNTCDENDIFFDCNEDAIEDSNSQSPPEDHHDVAIQESHSSAPFWQEFPLLRSGRQHCDSPRHPTLIRGDVDQANILPFPCRPKAPISMEDIDPLSYSNAVSGRKDSWINYQSAIGSLSYLSTETRPDILFAVSSLSQFLELPGIKNWNAFMHVLQYLKGTSHQSLVYPIEGKQGVQSYCNTDWGNCHQARRSVTGFIVMFNGCLVIWKTRKQPTVSLSTAEAEYKALTDLSAKLLWLRQFIQELALHLVEGPIKPVSTRQTVTATEKIKGSSMLRLNSTSLER
ncbi:hypothetical protein O181_005755 [Austropuccinia psidii MF-1]|uniref:Integrase catalytic domain-containing protein n=1 Tax=Austropuccinia psidii MF-1 TaxID=1389203 RepID=A0A9Q3BIZ9_9BASI|nr:hypothetical protein [Austropuccinia psidii MF-1]